ncbi:Hypothetical protein SMAX5B_019020 [Scophthalmus maximus]|uniref:Uncharacterized protein n=1 Tax=Scophthalmus maximus TaxID=52904 RepID=A0A2U9C7U8_SCOMX|nr:Hypothetical protein SMAX5B_019020 [Scophthalmus maximus]
MEANQTKCSSAPSRSGDEGVNPPPPLVVATSDSLFQTGSPWRALTDAPNSSRARGLPGSSMRTSSTSSSLRVSPVPSPDCLRLQKPLTHRTKARARSVRGTPQLSQLPPPSPHRPPDVLHVKVSVCVPASDGGEHDAAREGKRRRAAIGRRA